MSESVIFVVGVIVFALTVWGAVMAGGMALSQIEIEQNPQRRTSIDAAKPRRWFRIRGRY